MTQIAMGMSIRKLIKLAKNFQPRSWKCETRLSCGSPDWVSTSDWRVERRLLGDHEGLLIKRLISKSIK